MAALTTVAYYGSVESHPVGVAVAAALNPVWWAALLFAGLSDRKSGPRTFGIALALLLASVVAGMAVSVLTSPAARAPRPLAASAPSAASPPVQSPAVPDVQASPPKPRPPKLRRRGWFLVPQDRFFIGSTMSEVKRIQGPPDSMGSDPDSTWFYGLSYIEFKDGRVDHYFNSGGLLKVAAVSPTKSPGTFTMGSPRSMVLAVQGPPDSMGSDPDSTWFYGLSYIEFKDGRVDHYFNSGGLLKIR